MSKDFKITIFIMFLILVLGLILFYRSMGHNCIPECGLEASGIERLKLFLNMIGDFMFDTTNKKS